MHTVIITYRTHHIYNFHVKVTHFREIFSIYSNMQEGACWVWIHIYTKCRFLYFFIGRVVGFDRYFYITERIGWNLNMIQYIICATILNGVNRCYFNRVGPYPIEITTIDTIQNCCTDNVLYHIEVPPYSFGYIKVPIKADYPPYEKIKKPAFSVNVYPNPASAFLHITVNGKDFTEMSNFNVKIINMMGSVCYNNSMQNNDAIDISAMSAGFYSLTIELSNGLILNKQFVKQ